MAKEHIEILEDLKIKIANRRSDNLYHFFLCVELDELGWARHVDDHSVEDIKNVIKNIFRPLALTPQLWEEYGIATMLGENPRDLSLKAIANQFREEVIDALIEDFRDEEVGCTKVRAQYV